jgi:hypothetical protein
MHDDDNPGHAVGRSTGQGRGIDPSG